jgi:CheY-like chemotaxis protein
VQGRPEILVVDDNAEVCAAVVDCLIDSYEVRHATDPLRAIQLLPGAHLLLVDWILPPGRDRLIAAAEEAGIPVMVMTGEAAAMDRLEAEAIPYLMKPFGESALRGKIAGAIIAGRAFSP